MKKILLSAAILTAFVVNANAMDFKIVPPNGVRACQTEYRECTAKCPPVGSANFDQCITECYGHYNECINEGGHPNA
jgi:hypothetical protein